MGGVAGLFDAVAGPVRSGRKSEPRHRTTSLDRYGASPCKSHPPGGRRVRADELTGVGGVALTYGDLLPGTGRLRLEVDAAAIAASSLATAGPTMSATRRSQSPSGPTSAACRAR